MTDIVHMIGHEEGRKLQLGGVKDVRTRCGRMITEPFVEGTPSRYTMIAQNGNVYRCTTRHEAVSCKKCNSALVGNVQ